MSLFGLTRPPHQGDSRCPEQTFPLVPAPGAQKLGSPHRKPSVKHIAFLLSAYFVNIKSTHLRAPAYVLSSQKIPFKPSPPLKVDLPIGEGFSRGYRCPLRDKVSAQSRTGTELGETGQSPSQPAMSLRGGGLVMAGSMWPPGEGLVTTEGGDIRALSLLSQVPVAQEPSFPKATGRACAQRSSELWPPGDSDSSGSCHIWGHPRDSWGGPGPFCRSVESLHLSDSLQTCSAVPGF